MRLKDKGANWVRILGALCLILPIVCFGLIFGFGNPWLHNWNLKRLKNGMASIPHPPGTSSLKFVEGVGNLAGTHDQIDYFVGDVRTYSVSKTRIKSFYATRKVWNPIARRFEAIKIVFANDTSSEAQSLAWTEDVNGWSIFPTNNHKNQKTYIIYVHDGGYGPGLDLRGY